MDKSKHVSLSQQNTKKHQPTDQQQLGKMLPPQALQQMGGAGALQGLLKAFEGATGMGGGGGKGGGGPFG